MTGVIGTLVCDTAVQIMSLMQNPGQSSLGISISAAGLVTTVVVGYAVTMAYQKTNNGGDS
jgi:hypothetical protein